MAVGAVFDAVKAALGECLGLGLAEVERVCNQERERRLLIYRTLPPTAIPEPTMSNITAAVAIDELTPPFALIEPPDPIVVDFTYPRHRSVNPNAPNDRPSMAVGVPGLRLFAFVDAIDVSALRERYSAAPVRESVFHEFLHLCGDATLNGATDGILRHNLAGMRRSEPVWRKHRGKGDRREAMAGHQDLSCWHSKWTACCNPSWIRPPIP